MNAQRTTRGNAMTIEVTDLRIDVGGKTVIPGLSLNIAPGEILVLTGPSGCGKSTLLRAVAGLSTPVAGAIVADGEPVTTTSRDRAMVFQEDVLLPWRSVRANMDLALRLRGVPRRRRPAQIDTWLTEVGLADAGDHLPRSLSGGMRQRVQLARGLAGAPRAVLMDEPFGALDTQTRVAMQSLLVRTLEAHPTTVVFVTHDVDEALVLGDRVVVLSADGRIRDDIAVPAGPDTPDAPNAAALAAARARILTALTTPEETEDIDESTQERTLTCQ